MRTLIVILAVLGFVVGGIPLVGSLIDVMTSPDETIVYQVPTYRSGTCRWLGTTSRQ